MGLYVPQVWSIFELDNNKKPDAQLVANPQYSATKFIGFSKKNSTYGDNSLTKMSVPVIMENPPKGMRFLCSHISVQSVR